jgi:hypothetical protein
MKTPKSMLQRVSAMPRTRRRIRARRDERAGEKGCQSTLKICSIHDGVGVAYEDV